MKEKDISNIRPSKGVKIKKPQIIENVKNDIPIENLPHPTEESIKLIEKVNNAKQDLVLSMRAFTKLLSDTKLTENHSESDKGNETNIINDLIKATQTIESLEPGDGLLSLCVFTTRLSILLRNAGNKIAFKVYNIEKRLEQIEAKISLEPNKERDKKILLDQAKKLGLKVNIE